MKKQNGITLIALVITIIVLLILAGVTIVTLTGDNGLLTKAGNAKNTINDAEIGEKIRLAYQDYYMAQYSDSGYTFQDALNKTFGEGVATASGLDSNGVYTVSVNGKSYLFNPETRELQTVAVIDWDTVIENAQPHPDQSPTITDIGIDMYGNPVNLDYWSYDLLDDGENKTIRIGKQIGSKANELGNGYIGSYSSDGKILGEIPQYIKKENETYTLTSLKNAFLKNYDIKISPIIPNSVTNMKSTFSYCTSLTKAPEIPNSVINMDSTFSHCTSLTTAPEIPNSVINMDSTFSWCTSLTTAPAKIPNSVISMESTFGYCAITQAPTIPNSVTKFSYTFQRCSLLEIAPIIPNSVTNLHCAFIECANLKGDLVINASNVENYEYCLRDTSTNEGCNLVVSGSCPRLDEIIATKSSNSHITKGN